MENFKKRSTSPMIKHANHTVIIKLISEGKHYAKYHCVDCNKFVAWVSRSETNAALKLGLVNE